MANTQAINDWETVPQPADDWETVSVPEPPHPGPPGRAVVPMQTSTLGKVGHAWETARKIANTDVLQDVGLPSVPKLMEGVNDLSGFKPGQDWAAQHIPGVSAVQKFAHGSTDLAKASPTNALSFLPIFKGPRLVQAIAEGGRAALQTGLATDSPTASGVMGAVTAGVPYLGNVVRWLVPNRNNAATTRALDYMGSSPNPVPMTMGQRSGNEFVLGTERNLPNLPGAASRAEKFYGGQQEAAANKLRGIINKTSPVNADVVDAGQGVVNKGTQTISNLKAAADAKYNEIRHELANNPTTLQVGEKPMLNSSGQQVVGPNGQAVTTPVYGTFQAPVDMDVVRQELSPIYEDLTKYMPPAQRDFSPAYAAIKKIMDNKDRYMDAMDVDKGLSAFKTMIRDGQDNPYLGNQMQKVGTAAVNKIEGEFQGALNQVNPQLLTKLNQARPLVRQYHEVGELLNSLPKEPADLYKKLTTAGDSSYNTLTAINKIAPGEIKTVGRTYLQGLFDKATAEGGFSRSAGIFADWNKLGDRAKGIMFGPQQTQDLDNFFLGAKKLFPDKGSSTSHNFIAFGAAGAAGAMITHMITGDWKTAADVAGGIFIGPNIAARILYSPVGARLLSQAVTLPPTSVKWRAVMGLLNAKLGQMSQQKQ